MIICADDYALRADIDRAILTLCAAGRLSAVSCMVLFERCDRAAMEKILAHQGAVDIGLHFCLTNENLPLSPPLEKTRLPEFKTLFRRALLRNFKPDEIFNQLAVQYDLFQKKTGRAPDYIDGHLHAHQLPGVAEELVRFVRSLPAASRPYLRNTQLPLADLRQRRLPWLKAGFIGWFGTRLGKMLRAENLATNTGFAGIYDFKNWRCYPEYFPKFADCLDQANGILVTHPGFDEAWRQSEFAVLQNHQGRVNRFQR
jgi:chitin disaccharide deacetylase